MTTNAHTELIGVIGLASFCAMLRPPFFGSLVNSSIIGFAALRAAYDASLLFLGLALLIVATAKLQRSPACTERIAVAMAGISTVAGILVINIARVMSIGNGAVYLCGIFLLCAGFANLTVIWFKQLARRPRERIPLLVLEAFIVSHLFGLIDAFPREAAACASIAYPVLSSACLLMLARGNESHREESFEQKETPPTKLSSYFKRLRVFALSLIVVEAFVGALLRSRWAQGGVSYDPTMNTAITYAVSALFGLIFLLVIHRSKSAAEESLIIGAIGLAGFTVATVLFSTLSAQMLAPFVTGLYSALLVFIMALLALWSPDGDRSCAYAAGGFLAIYATVSGITTTLIPAALRYEGTMPDEYLAFVGVLAGLVISLAVCSTLFFMVVVHRESYLKAIKELSPDLPNDHESVSERLGLEYGLTEREKETALLLAQGYSFKRVAEELGVAPATVQGYSKVIYRKMGVHKKDELIEIVNLVR